MNKNRVLKLLPMLLALLAFCMFAFASCEDTVTLTVNEESEYSDSQLVGYDDSGLSFGENGNSISLAKPSASRTVDFQEVQPSFHRSDPNIAMIEINQSLSYGFDADTGEFYLMENFVASKETALFVEYHEAVDWNTKSLLMKVERNDETVASFTPAILDEYTLLFQPKNMASAGNWEQGAYTFSFYVDDEEMAVRTANFYESVTIKVLAVPIKANYSGTIASCEGDWKSGGTMLYATYPLGRSNIEYVLAPELDLSSSYYDLNDDEGQYNVWDALRNLQTPNKDYELIIGFIRYAADNGRLAGYTYGLPANIVTESDSDMLATVVHEVAHCYKIGDEYEGGSLNVNTNPPPYGMKGHDINTRQAAVGAKEKVIGGDDAGISGTGSVIYADQRAYWVEGRTLLGDVTSYMGAGTGADSFSMWTTSDIWNHLFKVFTGMNSMGAAYESGGAEDAEYYEGYEDSWQCPECYGEIDLDMLEFYTFCYECYEWTEIYDYDYICELCDNQDSIEDDEELYILCGECCFLISYESLVAYNSGYYAEGKTAAASVNAIDITGYIENGAFFPTPWYTYETDASNISNRRSGDYCIYFYDESGNLTDSSYFDALSNAQFTASDGTVSSGGVNRIPVSVTVRFPENTAKIVIQKGENALYTTDVSKTAPEVAFTGLTDYQNLENKVTLTWEASGEKDELYFELWYCPAEDEYYNIASNITGNSYDVDLLSYPGTSEGYFYIYATDGVRTGEAASEWVKVPYKAPEIISVQESVPEIKITGEICFDADIYDMQDGYLWREDEVIWTLDGKEFMSGSYLWVWPYELAPGTYTFTCTAVNSAGMTAEKDFTFRILDDESDLPDDWSRADIQNALSNGFTVPLNRIDAPITRGQYASLMTVLYGSFSESDDPYPDYEENVVTDCGQDDYDQFLMVKLGIMEAANGIFEPDRALTEQEAAVIMYRIMEAADPDYMMEIMDLNAGTDDIISFYSENEIIGSSPGNAFSADERLTNRLALVRLSRLYDVIWDE